MNEHMYAYIHTHYTDTRRTQLTRCLTHSHTVVNNTQIYIYISIKRAHNFGHRAHVVTQVYEMK